MSKRFANLTLVTIVLALALSILAPRADGAEAVALIVNKANPVESLTLHDIKKIYTNYILSWPDGVPIIIYDLAIQEPIRSEFSQKVLGRSPEKVAQEWAHLKITNQAKNPPLMMKSEALVIRRVLREKGAIGYVSLDAARSIDGIRIVHTLQ